MSSNNISTSLITMQQASKSIVDVLNNVSQNFLIYLPLIFCIPGLIGFIGNVFTYLQAELRSNTCCIYLLCSSAIDMINLSFNLFPRYLTNKYGINVPWFTTIPLCKFDLFLLVFLPHSSINLLLMSTIDRFASSCALGSPIRRLNQLKMVPWLIIAAIVYSGLTSIQAPILYDTLLVGWCVPSQPTTYSILYILFNGLLTPLLMTVFILLTYRNVRRSRRRVGGVNTLNHRHARNQFIIMVFCQVLATAFFSLQWIVMYMYYTITINFQITNDQATIVFFAFSVTNYVFYLNNVKSFYLSILTCRLFRKTFFKGVINLLPRQMRPRFQITQTNQTVNTVQLLKRGETLQH